MRAYGFFTDEEIEDTVSTVGYRAGRAGDFSGLREEFNQNRDNSIRLKRYV